MSQKHEWSLDHQYRTLCGCLPWYCVKCGRFVDTMLDLARLRKCVEVVE